jgi:hypothetical protein
MMEAVSTGACGARRLLVKLPLALLAVALLGVGAGGCGGARKGAVSASRVTSKPATSYYDGDDASMLSYGHAANAADERAIAALVKRYFAAAAVEDGAKACALTYALRAETLPERYGQSPGPLYLRGATTCPALLSRAFTHFHSLLAQAAVELGGVRVEGHRAVALLGFGTKPASYIAVRREGGAWKIDGLLVTRLP